jgi:hypothetical protein
MLYPIIKNLSPKKWRQRNPFKNKDWEILKSQNTIPNTTSRSTN